ncbi:MAG: sigma-54 dependent transcriptional regulator [Bacteroidales bacterium]|nr:sigma-54 dependent transcriptional regulator [Bacteroidales bacterium]
METSKLNILVLDDDPIIRNLMRSILKEKATMFSADKPSKAFEIMKDNDIDIILCDFMMPEMDGLEVLDKVKEDYPHIEVVMISAEGDMDTVIGALRRGAVDYFRKPFRAEDIWIAIERTRKFAEMNADLAKYKHRNTYLQGVINEEVGVDIVGKTPAIEEVKKQMQQVAKTHDTSVLILGESGSGKELVARGIHKMSSRKDEVFGAVNMSAVPESLFESEFFGHKKGSFTGAVADKAGWFEMTNKGTLFFDEIGEMDQSLQVKLLRVLEDRKYTRVGTQKEESFDIRIIAATNKTVEEMSQGRIFRSDLYYRLSTFTIYLPPLRDRADDIPLLVEHFFGLSLAKMGKNIKGIHPDVVDILSKYRFPGNIRELKNLMERAVIICDGKELLPDHFPQIVKHKPKPETTEGSMPAETEVILDLKEVERRTIVRALEQTNYNKNEAAKLLNLDWNALYRRMQKYNIG